ncbi:hypothetical protein AGDE_13442 [Angomonas deanei]|nr:hypothetical protein AGDE_13442 [Angomonas deanei]|eukprot:EPY22379.1 hypothetical protein AGDE_13442 [Angomonas deanei]
MFKDQYIAVVCTTTTLALGVNLPAHLVIIKGTSFFKNGKREDIPLSDMAQMCGRAGRPGLDSHGVAVVLTTDSKVKFYQSLQNGDVYSTVESQLHQHMIEHVNAEIALRTISGFHSALDWVRTTFFWIRLQRAPESYGLAFSTRAERDGFKAEVYIERLLDKVLRALEAEQCIVARSKTTEQLHDLNNEHQEVDLRDQDTIVESTRVGRSMARLYILFGTVQTFNNGLRSQTGKTAGLTLTGGEKNTTEEGSEQSDDDVEPEQDAADEQPLVNGGGKPFKIQQLLRLLCHSEEFLEIRLRQGDRGPLNELNKSVKYILKNGHKGGREVREDWHKAYILVQCQLGQLPIQDISLKNDFMRLWSLVPRVARFLVDYAWCTNLYSMALHAVSLLHCIEQHVWEDGLVLKQLDWRKRKYRQNACAEWIRHLSKFRTGRPPKDRSAL